MDSMGNYLVAAGKIVDGRMGGAKKESSEALAEKEAEAMGVETCVDAIRAIKSRSIKGFINSETSSSTLDFTDIGKIVSKGNVTDRISTSPNINRIAQGQERASRSTIICTSASTNWGTPDNTGVLAWILQDGITSMMVLFVRSGSIGNQNPCSYLCSKETF